ncbi:MAG: DUF4340 domain-containing protein [Wenzhouxiangella sp.]
MSPRHILSLGVLTLVALVLALIVAAPDRAHDDSPASELIPALADQVNAVDRYRVHFPDGREVITLFREGQRWRIEEYHGFEADFEAVADSLRLMAQARRASPRTRNPEWFPRLGLNEPGAPAGAGMMVSFPEYGLPSLIIGELDPQGQGHFVRLAGDDQAWLADRRIDLPARPIDWLQRSIMDIPAAELVSVTVLHPDGDQIQLRAADESGEDWVLMNVPEDRLAVAAWQRRAPANGLANLRLDDVAPAIELPDDAVRALYVTRDGLNFVASLFRDDQDAAAGGWLQFEVSAELDAMPSDADEAQHQRLLADAAAVNQTLSAWRYKVDESRFSAMTPRLDRLLEPVED